MKYSRKKFYGRNNKDYGTLMCIATNEVGTQRHPCIFHIILAGNIFLKKALSVKSKNIFYRKNFFSCTRSTGKLFRLK
jgi:hypothetical protein